jgi:hypothetical protein
MSQVKILAVIAGVFSCALVLTAQAGDVYRYVDERGNAIFTDKPIPGAVLVTTGAQRPDEVSDREYAEQQASNNAQLAASNRRIEETGENQRAAATVAKDLESTRAERCKKARDHYQLTINSQRLYREKDGQRQYLTDAELAAARVDALKAVEAVCGNPG